MAVERVISSWSEVPRFELEADEAAFWAVTRVDKRLMDMSVLKKDVREPAAVTLKLDPLMFAAIKRLARSRYLEPAQMMKQWLAERLDREVGRKE